MLSRVKNAAAVTAYSSVPGASIMRSMIRACSVLALLLAAGFALAQTEFSAEIHNNQKPDSQAKIYFGKDKMRFESADKDLRHGGAVIVKPCHPNLHGRHGSAAPVHGPAPADGESADDLQLLPHRRRRKCLLRLATAACE